MGESILVVIVSACHFLIVDPATKKIECRDFVLPPFTEQISAQQCIIGVQAQVAKTWYWQHPGWKITKITCEKRTGFGSSNDKVDKADI